MKDLIPFLGALAAATIFSLLYDESVSQFVLFLYSIGFLASVCLAVTFLLPMLKDFIDSIGGPDDFTPA